jgi:hypothetical protein
MTLDKLVGKIEHKLNPLHVYCRLRDCHISKEYAIPIVRYYEKNLYKPLTKVLYGQTQPTTERNSQPPK